jgi:5-oxoprolinase (ATP-hydrolysing) subunit A
MSRIDLNADVGEGLAQADEWALLRHVSSANVACGGHTGDVDTMRATLDVARALGVAVGAHPSFQDREHFGRREYSVAAPVLEALLVEQLAALEAVAATFGLRLQHVKPHGALYNVAAKDPRVAETVARAVASFDARLILVGQAGSALVTAAQRAGLRAAGEGFADRAYRPDGSLVPRTEPNAVLLKEAEVVSQTLRMVVDGEVVAVGGTRVPLQVETVCVHGDTPGAVRLAAAVREALDREGVSVGPL